MFLYRRYHPKKQLSCLPLLCTCPVLIDPSRLNITQSVWVSKYAEILLHMNFQVARECQLQGVHLLWLHFPHSHQKYTWLLCMRCGPSYEINMVRVAWLHPPPKMYFHVNAMGASSHWYSRATRPSHFFSWDRTEANSSPKHYGHFIFAHNKPWLGKRVPHQETPKG